MGWRDRIASIFGSQNTPPKPGDDYWYGPHATDNGAGIRVTADIAMKASAVFACVKVIAETIASMPLRVFRELEDGSMMPAPNHPIDDIIRRQANETQTALEFWETMLIQAALKGTAYAEIIPGRRGLVDQLRPLQTDRVIPEVLPDKSLRFRVQDYEKGTSRILLQDEVFRITGMSTDGVSGIRAVDAAAEAIGLGIAADQYAARVFRNSLNIGVVLEHPGKLSPEGQKNLIDAYMARLAGPFNAHRPLVVQEGMKAQRFSQSATEAQLLDARKWQIGEIARFWKIPLHMLGIDDQTNRSTVEEQSANFVKYTLLPWGRRIEQAIWRDLLLTRGYEAKYNFEGLMRGNAQARAEYFSKALGAGGAPGWMTPNEIRRIEGLNPHPDGDKLPVATNIPKAEAPKALAAPDKTMAVEDNRIEARAERLARKENAALRRASKRFAGDKESLQNWVKAFYSGHVSVVMELLWVAKPVAKAYCEFQRDQALKAPDFVAMIDWREENLARQIAETMVKHQKDTAPEAVSAGDR